MDITTKSSFIKQFAENYSLNIWDWFAAIIAFVSLLIAISSLIIAFQTLRSQRATQRNTTPIITLEIQKKIWQKLIERLCNHMNEMRGLKILIDRNKYTKIPEGYYFQNFCISPEDYIHEELFYTNEYRFASVHRLKEQLNSYNNYFTNIAIQVNNHHLTETMLNKMIEKTNIVLNVALYGYLSAFRVKTTTLQDYEFFPTEGTDETIYEELIAHFQKNQGAFLNHYGRERVKKMEGGAASRKESEKNNQEDAYTVFFGRFGNGKYKKFLNFYNNYSNKYIDYYLSTNTVDLVNVKDDGGL